MQATYDIKKEVVEPLVDYFKEEGILHEFKDNHLYVGIDKGQWDLRFDFSRSFTTSLQEAFVNLLNEMMRLLSEKKVFDSSKAEKYITKINKSASMRELEIFIAKGHNPSLHYTPFKYELIAANLELLFNCDAIRAFLSKRASFTINTSKIRESSGYTQTNYSVRMQMEGVYNAPVLNWSSKGDYKTAKWKKILVDFFNLQEQRNKVRFEFPIGYTNFFTCVDHLEDAERIVEFIKNYIPNEYFLLDDIDFYEVLEYDRAPAKLFCDELFSAIEHFYSSGGFVKYTYTHTPGTTEHVYSVGVPLEDTKRYTIDTAKLLTDEEHFKDTLRVVNNIFHASNYGLSDKMIERLHIIFKVISYEMRENGWGIQIDAKGVHFVKGLYNALAKVAVANLLAAGLPDDWQYHYSQTEKGFEIILCDGDGDALYDEVFKYETFSENYWKLDEIIRELKKNHENTVAFDAVKAAIEAYGK